MIDEGAIFSKMRDVRVDSLLSLAASIQKPGDRSVTLRRLLRIARKTCESRREHSAQISLAKRMLREAKVEMCVERAWLVLSKHEQDPTIALELAMILLFNALEMDPNNVAAVKCLAAVWAKQGRFN
jgi:hypothetical protein